MWLGALLLAAGVLLLVHGVEPESAAVTPSVALRPCTLGATRAECGRLSVAENPADPDGQRIALNVAVVRARSARPRPDPLVWFAGWGSGGVSDDAASVVSAFTGVNANRDLVFVDQRGTGSSELRCRLPLTQRPTPARSAASPLRRAEAIGPNLRYYTSAVAVDDIDQVRRALGYDRINIYGGSYGVTTGQIYLLRHGSHVRTAVFDSGSLLDVRIFERQPRQRQPRSRCSSPGATPTRPATAPIPTSVASTTGSSPGSPETRSRFRAPT